MAESGQYFSKRSLGDILDNMQDVYFRTDRSGRFIYTSKAVKKLIGVEPKLLIGKFLSDYCATGEECNCSLKAALETGQGVVSDLRFAMQHIDGTIKWVSMSAVNFQEQTYRGVEGSIRDITEQKNAEEKNALLQRQLRQAQKMEAIGQLTGGLAHDFNNILTSILGYAGLGQLQYRDESREQLLMYFQQVAKSGARARDLISNMLTYSRGTSTKQKTVQPALLFDELQPMLRAVLPTSIRLSIRLDDDLPVCKANIGQLQQVIMNLCINAKDAMNDVGEIEIRVSRHSFTGAECASCHNIITSDYVVCSVSDNGAGINESILGFIFDPFFSTKETGKGSGMGLSMAHGIVHEHRGHITLESGETGTTISFLLPIETVAKQTVQYECESNIEPASETEQAKVLVVDDESAIALLLEEMFKENGYEVVSLTSSVDAKELIKNALSEFDLLVTDQTMPSVSGLDLTEYAHQIDPDFPVIICSGYSKKINASNYREFRVFDFIEKPIEMGHLMRATNAALRKRSVAVAS